MKPATYELSVTRLIEVAPEHVWRVMVDRLAEWWCPRPWMTEIERLDRHAGGESCLVMRGPDGEIHRTPGLVLAWDEGHRFAFTDAIGPDLMPADPFMIGIWSIRPEGSGTRYKALARHWTPEAMRQHREMGFEAGWAAVADQLKALCEGRTIS